MNLNSQDYGIIGGGILLSFLGAFATEAGIINASLAGTITTWLPRITVLTILVGIVFVYLSRDLLGGEIVQNLEVVATGFLIYAVTWWPHKMGYHAEALGGAASSIFGVFTTGAWNVFFHTLTAAVFGLVSFGFYRFWEMSQEVNA
ncbi:hypothetical protein AQV86_02085 [Nanohaloarchaea archaeon SG9]|nr:hypothetical protein AQV86_02085 [Nanohaloarchaea archaeon SG9]